MLYISVNLINGCFKLDTEKSFFFIKINNISVACIRNIGYIFFRQFVKSLTDVGLNCINMSN